MNSQQDCYGALGVVHGAWRHIPVEFDDYISAPKENGYQSLHTAVLGPDGKPVEVQIRTRDMHQNAEYGVAAHWRYKEGGPLGPEAFLDKLAWIRQILTWQEDGASAGSFVDAVKTDFFSDTVFVFTPRGEVKDLPIGSTPLDFAYRIHSDVGHSCIGAKVNRRLVPLDHELENGDVVEILTSTSSKGPSRAWLSLVRTAHARDKIRRWFKQHEKAENVASGRVLLDRELRRVGQGGVANVPDADLKAIATSLGYLDVESLLAGVGYGATTVHQVITRLRAHPGGGRAGSAGNAGTGRAARRAAAGQRARRRQPADPRRGLLPSVAGGRHRGVHHARPRDQHPPPQLHQRARRFRARAAGARGLGRPLG